MNDFEKEIKAISEYADKKEETSPGSLAKISQKLASAL